MINRACGQQFIGITRQPPRPVGEKGKDASKALLDGKESQNRRATISTWPHAQHSRKPAPKHLSSAFNGFRSHFNLVRGCKIMLTSNVA